MSEEDLVLGEPIEKDELDVIDNQLTVIGSIIDIDVAMYPDIEIEIKMAMSYAFKIIVKAQKKILKEL